LRALAGGAEAAARAAGFGEEELTLLRRPPRCAVLAGGRTSRHLWPPAEPLFATPTLHVMSEADTRIPFALQEQLRNACGAAAEALLHDKGHALPAAAAPSVAIAAFLLRHVGN
jgi:hypothetical protein